MCAECVQKVQAEPTPAHHMTEAASARCCVAVACAGHTCEGYGLSWSVLQQGHVLSGSNDQLVCTWDVQGMPERGRVRAHFLSTGHTLMCWPAL
jgi:hypothetical protein